MPCYLLLSFLRFCRTFGFLLGLVLQSMEDTAEKRVRILQTVRDLVLERGLQNVSMSLISKSTKVPIGSIYNLFPSKEALVNAVYVYCRDSFYQSVLHSELDSGSGFEVNFKIFVRRYIHSAIDHAQNYLFVEQYHLSPAIDPVVISDSNIFIGDTSLQQAMDQGILAPQPVELLSNMLIGLIHFCIDGHLTRRQVLDERQIDMIAEACWKAARA